MSAVSRREILGSAALAGGWLILAGDAAGQEGSAATQPAAAAGDGPYTVPPLPYDYADLEPHIDAETMKLHHDVHHAAYVTGANLALAELERIRRSGGEEYGRVRAVTDSLAFNLAGHILHTIFWGNLHREGGGDPPADSPIAAMIRRDFGSIDKWREHFSWAAMQVQGGGWGVLAYEPLGRRLIVLAAEKHQNLSAWGAVPLLVVDVWEHAYYLKYQHRRASYLKAFMNVIDWRNVDQRLAAAGASAP
jgi:Fe-Mn family superoxide dismutase